MSRYYYELCTEVDESDGHGITYTEYQIFDRKISSKDPIGTATDRVIAEELVQYLNEGVK